MESQLIGHMDAARSEIREWTLARDRARRDAAMRNSKVGIRARLARKRLRAGLRETAREMGCSPGFLVDLETGRRWWTQDHAEDFYCALVRISKRTTP